MIEFARKVELLPGWDVRGQTPNYGQHPPHLLIWVLGPKGAAVLNINTGWYINDVAAPHVDGIAIHAYPRDPYVEESELHDGCRFLEDGATCVVEWERYRNPGVMQAVKASGLEWTWRQLEALYLAHFEGGAWPEWEAEPVDFSTAEGRKELMP